MTVGLGCLDIVEVRGVVELKLSSKSSDLGILESMFVSEMHGWLLVWVDENALLFHWSHLYWEVHSF